MFRRGSLMEQIKKEQDLQEEKQKQLSELARAQQMNEEEKRALNTLLKIKQGILNNVNENIKLNQDLENKIEANKKYLDIIEAKLNNSLNILKQEETKQNDLKQITYDLGQIKNNTEEKLTELKTDIENKIKDLIYKQGEETQKLRKIEGEVISKTNELRVINNNIASQNTRKVELESIIEEKQSIISLKDKERDDISQSIFNLIEMKKTINNNYNG